MSRKLRIGFDIDDVLLRTASRTIELYNQLHGTNLTKDHWYAFDDLAPWGTDKYEEAARRVTDIVASDDFRDVEPVKGAEEVIRSLVNAGHEVFAITGRPENVRSLTLELLDQHYHGLFKGGTVFFTNHYGPDHTRLAKSDIAAKLKLTHFVDDQIGHVDDLNASGVKSILFSDNYKWSESPASEGVVRVNSWQEIKEFFDAEQAQ